VSQHLISVVVPVYNVAEYVPECLDSILGQPGADIEVIAVDDASPDGSGAILDERAAADPRLRVLHLATNAGLGGARNAGMAVATGTYLLFVDSDDYLAEGALAVIAAAVVDEPDLLVFDYDRVYPDGRSEPNPRSAALSGPAGIGAGLHARPELLTVLPVVWNKAYRRDWLVRQGVEFRSGFYEDVAWTYPALVSAQTVAVLDRVCYHYRQGRASSILGAADRRHFEVFAQYDAVFGYLEAHPEYEHWRAPLFDRMLRHYAMLLTLPDRVPPSQKAEFFDRAASAYQRWRPPGWQPPRGTSGIKPRAFASGSYRRFRTAQLVSELQGRLRRR